MEALGDSNLHAVHDWAHLCSNHARPGLQGTVLATVGHINNHVLPDLLAEYKKFDGKPHASLSAQDKDKKSHIVTAIKNWAVSHRALQAAAPHAVPAPSSYHPPSSTPSLPISIGHVSFEIFVMHA